MSGNRMFCSILVLCGNEDQCQSTSKSQLNAEGGKELGIECLVFVFQHDQKDCFLCLLEKERTWVLFVLEEFASKYHRSPWWIGDATTMEPTSMIDNRKLNLTRKFMIRPEPESFGLG